MTEEITGPRSTEFYILRTCERLGIHFDEFQELDYARQLKLLAYNSIRQLEDQDQQS